MPAGRRHQLVAALARGDARLQVTSDSMAPTLAPSESVRVTRSPVRPGDVAVFARQDGVLVTHRLLLRVWLPRFLGGPRWLQAGDARPLAAGFIRDAQVLGRVELPARLPRPRDRARIFAAALRRAVAPHTAQTRL